MKRVLAEYGFGFLDALTYSNLWVSLGSFCFTLQAAFFSDSLPDNVLKLACLNGLTTFCLYNLQRLYNAALSQDDARSRWVQRHRRGLFTSMLLAVFVSIPLIRDIYSHKPFVIWTYVVLGILSVLYFLPPFRLRKYGQLKPFLIGFVFAVTGGYFVLSRPDGTITLTQGFYLLVQWLWISVICLPFDIRDSKKDKGLGIPTIPVQHGIKFTKLLGYGLLLLALLLLVNGYTVQKSLPFFIIVLISAVLLGCTNLKRHRYYYSILIDGLLILQLVITGAWI
ncbi:MAG: UbiA family prenyltransferase [Sediminibacterium sp.]|nr:UbiA family prenyltransferase [Sediminibacterium sp.]